MAGDDDDDDDDDDDGDGDNDGVVLILGKSGLTSEPAAVAAIFGAGHDDVCIGRSCC